MTDQTEIYNLALDAIGSQSTVSGPLDTSEEANALNRHWRPAIEQVLRAVHWNFARHQVAMTLLKDASIGDSTPAPWQYEYAYPPNCVLARYILPTFQTIPGDCTPMGPTIRFLLGSDDDSGGNAIRVILTNQPQAVLVYTRMIKDPTLFDPEFVEGLRLYLGSRIAIALTGDKDKRDDCFAKAMTAINQARSRNGNEGITVHAPTPDWMRVRGVVGDWAYPEGSLYFCEPQALSLIA